jgi:hypothetical protein
VLEPAVIELLESDAVTIVGTVDAAGGPEATYAWTARVIDEGATQLRVLVPTAEARTHATWPRRAASP